MAYAINDECISCGACDKYVIDADTCIDCGACHDVCPVSAPNPQD